MKKIKLQPENKKIRLDQYLVETLNGKYSRSYIQRLISDNLILVDGKSAKAHLKLKGTEEISINLPDKKEERIEPEDIALDIIYEDNDLLVLNKPAGIIVHPASGRFKHTIVNALLNYTDNLSSVAGDLKPGIVHRLDKDTSGLLVVAKNNKTHKDIARQFKERTVVRKYISLVHGVVQLDRGVIDAPIGRSGSDRKKMDIDYLSKKDAMTHYEVLDRFDNATLLELTLKTGRTHQVRVHLRHIGHPIIGDKSYGVKKDAPRQMLHAKILGFIHPANKKYIEFKAAMPKDIRNYINRISK